MIYIVKANIGEKPEEKRFYSKAEAAAYYRLKVREMCFPDTIDIEILNDGD